MVEMTDAQRFDPAEITVEAGQTIEFTNDSSELHTVTAYEGELPPGADYFASGGFSSEEEARANLSEGLIDPGDTFEVTLDTPGRYAYFCIPHESQDMTGSITVEVIVEPDDVTD